MESNLIGMAISKKQKAGLMLFFQCVLLLGSALYENYTGNGW